MIKRYLITDPKLYGSDPKHFVLAFSTIFKRHRPDFVCLRDKSLDFKAYAVLAKSFLGLINNADTASKALLHGSVELAIKLGAYGVHLTSTQFDEIAKAKKNNLYVIISTHSHEEVFNAAELGADAVTYSPIFATPNKGEPKGLEDLNDIVGKIAINIFALGGITTPEQIKQIEKTGTYGFASIRYFLT